MDFQNLSVDEIEDLYDSFVEERGEIPQIKAPPEWRLCETTDELRVIAANTKLALMREKGYL